MAIKQTKSTPLRALALHILTIRWLWRPFRKMLHLSHEGVNYTLRLLQIAQARLPFVRVEGVRGHFIRNFDAIVKYYRALTVRVGELPDNPKISILVPVYKPDISYFREMLQSVAIQTYDNWELCLVDDCSQDDRIDEVVAEYTARFPGKVKFGRNTTNQHISVTTNACADLATGDYLALLDHDDRLYPNALGEMVRAINLSNRPEILYSDERTVYFNGNPYELPVFKPGFSPFYLLSCNYTSHLTLYDKSLYQKLGGMRQGFEGSQDHDLMLRAVESTEKEIVHVPFCLYQWRAHDESTATTASAKPYAAIAGVKAVHEALERRGMKAQVEWEPETLRYKMNWQIPDPAPMVSIVIPSKDAHQFISRCLESIFTKTTYKNFEVVIVDNGSTEDLVASLYETYRQKRSGRFRVVNSPGPFNFARLINTGVNAADGEYVLLLNNDTEVVTENWIEELLGPAMQPGVGSVGCRLVYPSGKIQHAGIGMVGEDIAVNLGVNLPHDTDIYFNYFNTLHDVYAISAACMMIKKQHFLEVGQMDDLWLPNGWGDVLFGITLREHGLNSIYTPYATLKHFESPSRGIAIEQFEQYYLVERYGHKLMNDPYLNPNLKRKSPTYTPRPDALAFELFEPMFTYLLTHDPDKWNKDEFMAYCKVNKIAPSTIVGFLP